MMTNGRHLTTPPPSLILIAFVLLDLCQNVHCKFGATCDAGVCVCPQVCPMAKEPVCGLFETDLVTYDVSYAS